MMILERDIQNDLQYKAQLATWNQDKRPEADRGPKPTKPPDTKFNDVVEQHEAEMLWCATLISIRSAHQSDYMPVSNWVTATVDWSLLSTIQEELVQEDKVNLQELVRHLKRMFAPTFTSTASRKRVT
jgi:hypothetical protein